MPRAILRCQHCGKTSATEDSWPPTLTWCCDAEMVVTGWRRSRAEFAQAMEQTTGLRFYGPHSRMMHETVFSLREPCGGCGGVGVLAVAGTLLYDSCPACEGGGGVFRVDPSEAIARVLAKYPDAVLR